MDVVFEIFNLVVSILAGIVMGSTAEWVLSPHPQAQRRVLLYVMFLSTLALPTWVGDENSILLFPFFIGAFLFCLPGERLARLVTGVIFFVLLVPLNMILDTAQRWFGFMPNDLPVMPLFKLLLWCVLAWLVRRTVQRGGVRLSRKLWLLLGSLTLAPLAAVLSFSLWNTKWVDGTVFRFYRETLNRLAFSILPFVCLSGLALLFAMVVLSRHETLEQEHRLADLRASYYENLKREQIQVRTLRHDLRNHLTTLQGLLEREALDEAGRYLAELSESAALNGGRRYCENEPANVVLSSKAAVMAAEGLAADFSVSLPKRLDIPAPELCALLGNALDNAIEAARTAEDKRILLRARAEKGLFMLRVENACISAVNADLSTTKEDSCSHGFGIAGMREIARRHSGSLEARSENGRFELVVCLALDQK